MTSFWEHYNAEQRAKAALRRGLRKTCIDCGDAHNRQSRRCLSCSIDRMADVSRDTKKAAYAARRRAPA